MDEQPALGTILFHVGLLTLIVLLVDERMMRGALAIIPVLLIAQRAMGATQSKESGEWSGIHDRRMDEHVRKHLEKLLAHFREFYAMNHLMSTGGMNSEEALVRANEIEKDLNRLLDEVTAGPEEVEAAPPNSASAPKPVVPEFTATQ